MNTYDVYIVAADGHTEYVFERRGKSADQVRRQLAREFPGAVVIDVTADDGERELSIKGQMR